MDQRRGDIKRPRDNADLQILPGDRLGQLQRRLQDPLPTDPALLVCRWTSRPPARTTDQCPRRLAVIVLAALLATHT